MHAEPCPLPDQASFGRLLFTPIYEDTRFDELHSTGLPVILSLISIIRFALLL